MSVAIQKDFSDYKPNLQTNFVKLQKQKQSSKNYTCELLRCKGGYKECMNIGFPSSNGNIQGHIKRKSLGELVSVKYLCILPSETKCTLLLLRQRDL